MKKLRPTIVVALAFTACGSTGSPPPNTTPVASTTSTTIVVTTAAEVEQFAFVRAIDESEITYDPARIFTGEEALEAARADGVLGEGETLDTDFYISNPSPDEEVAPLDPDGRFVLIGFDRYGALADRQISLDDLVAALNGADPEEFYGIVPGEVPMILTLSGDMVVGARQQYFP